MEQPLRFGVIGLGVIGIYHLKALRALGSGVEVVAAADTQAHRAAEVGREYGVAHYESAEALLAHPGLDVVTICTPSALHAPTAIAAMRAGKHVICEKPLDITLEAIDQILRVERETGSKLAGMFQRRFSQPAQALFEAVRQGRLGRLTFASAEIPLWRSQEYYDSGGWRGTWALDGGGCLMNQGIHTIDLMQWFMGPIVEVTAYAGTLAHQRVEVEDAAVAAVRFASGALGTIAGTTAAYPGLPTRITLGGDRGTAVLAENDLVWYHERREGAEAGSYGAVVDGSSNQAAELLAGRPATQLTGDAVVPGAELQQRVMLDMVAAIRQNRPPLVDGAEARKAVAVILAIYESAREGRPVAVR